MFLHVRPSRLALGPARLLLFNKVLKSWYGAWTTANQYSDSPGCFPSVVRTNSSAGKSSQSSVGGGPCPGAGCHWMSWGARIGAEAKQTSGAVNRIIVTAQSTTPPPLIVTSNLLTTVRRGQGPTPLSQYLKLPCSTLHWVPVPVPCPFYVLVNILQNELVLMKCTPLCTQSLSLRMATFQTKPRTLDKIIQPNVM